jgi:hypothetical protein
MADEGTWLHSRSTCHWQLVQNGCRVTDRHAMHVDYYQVAAPLMPLTRVHSGIPSFLCQHSVKQPGNADGCSSSSSPMIAAAAP